jgi:hypothetical protein
MGRYIMKKIILLGVILTAFLMIATPTLSATNIQVTEKSVKKEIEKTEEIETKSSIDLTVIEKQLTGELDELEQKIKNIDFTIRTFVIRMLGLAYAGLGAVLTVMVFLDPTIYLGMIGITSAIFGVMMALMNWLTGDNILKAFVDGAKGTVGAFTLYLLSGLIAVRMGLYMFIRGQFPDETTSFPLIDFIVNLMAPDVAI